MYLTFMLGKVKFVLLLDNDYKKYQLLTHYYPCTYKILIYIKLA